MNIKQQRMVDKIQDLIKEVLCGDEFQTDKFAVYPGLLECLQAARAIITGKAHQDGR